MKPARTILSHLAIALSLGGAIAGCGSTDAARYGEALFADPRLSSAGTNQFSCATCHASTVATDKVLPGYPLRDVATRPAYWGGTVTTLLDAMNECVTSFMKGSPLDADAEETRGLYVYLKSQGSEASATLPLTIVRNIADVPSADARRGAALFESSCGNCHGTPEVGTGRLSNEVTLIPVETLEEHGTDPLKGARLVTIEKVRHGKFFAIGGTMPPFSMEALSDAQLGDALAYLETFGLPASGTP